MLKELIMGFDCRAMGLSIVERWSRAEREEKLINPDIDRILTVDRMKWPSVFVTHSSQIDGVWMGTAPGYNLRIPTNYLTPEGYWDNLGEMVAFLSENKEHYQKPCWSIAITIVETEQYVRHVNNLDDVVTSTMLPKSDYTSPSEISIDWNFLGYAVEDYGQTYTKGLGSIYPEHILRYLRNKWREQINGNYLFSQLNSAIEFSNWSAQYETAASPYLVYGLYLIEKFPEGVK